MEAYVTPLAIFLPTSTSAFPRPETINTICTHVQFQAVFLYSPSWYSFSKSYWFFFFYHFISQHLKISPFQIKNNKGWRCSSVTECLTTMRKTLASISRTACLVVGKGFENLVIRVWWYLMGDQEIWPVALLEKVCHKWETLRFQMLKLAPVSPLFLLPVDPQM